MIPKNPIIKNTRKNGRWVERPLASKVSICACGNKYVKTREHQTTCIRCIYGMEPATRELARKRGK